MNRVKGHFYTFMNDTDRNSFVGHCESIGLSVCDEYLLPESVNSAKADRFDPEIPAFRIDVFFSLQYGNQLTIGRVSLPKNTTRDRSEGMKRVRSAYRSLFTWISEQFDPGLEEVLFDGSKKTCDRHWIGPDTRDAVENGRIELCFATNGNRFLLLDE